MLIRGKSKVKRRYTVFLRRLFVSSWLPLAIVGFLSATIYASLYANYSAVPGSDPRHPLGWWGWWDQSLYMQASLDFWTQGLSPEAHIYPPLYPLLGALLLPLSQMHSYLVPNLVLLLIFILFFTQTFRPLIGPWGAAAAASIGLLQHQMIVLQWVIPWTSSLAASFEMVGLFLFGRYVMLRENPDWEAGARIKNATAFAFCIGLLAPTRPVDFIAFLPLCLIYGAWIVRDGLCAPKAEGRGSWQSLVWCLLIGALPLTIYLAFNTHVFGGPFKGYFAVAQNAGGSTPHDLIDRAYSHIVDAAAYYGEQRSDWISTLPLMAISVCVMPFALLLGPPLLRAIAIVTLTHLALVYSYSDAVPTGQFRYFNIHYFKWMHVVLPAVLLSFAFSVFRPLAMSRTKAVVALAGTAGTFVALLAITPKYEIITPTSIAYNGPHDLVVVFDPPQDIDFIDIGGLSMPLELVNVHENRMSVDGTDLRPVAQARMTVTEGGMRMLLTDTTEVGTARLSLPDFNSQLKAAVPDIAGGRVSFFLSVPFRSDRDLRTLPAPLLVPGRTYNFSSTGEAHRFLLSGWSHIESWGRWMEGPVGRMLLRLPDTMPPNAALVLEAQAFIVPALRTEVTVHLEAAGQYLGSMKIDDSEPQSFVFPLPDVMAGQQFTLTIRADDTLSPRAAGIGSDHRNLSVGLISIALTP